MRYIYFYQIFLYYFIVIYVNTKLDTNTIVTIWQPRLRGSN